MASRQRDDGGWLVEPPRDPEIYREIVATIRSLPEKTQAMIFSLLNSVTSRSFALKDRVMIIDRVHDVYRLPPSGNPPCWVIVVNGYTGRPMTAALCTEKPGPQEAERLARRVLGLPEQQH